MFLWGEGVGYLWSHVLSWGRGGYLGGREFRGWGVWNQRVEYPGGLGFRGVGYPGGGVSGEGRVSGGWPETWGGLLRGCFWNWAFTARHGGDHLILAKRLCTWLSSTFALQNKLFRKNSPIPLSMFQFPGLHWSHRRPITLGKQGHWPSRRSHSISPDVVGSLPRGWQSQAKNQTIWFFLYFLYFFNSEAL